MPNDILIIYHYFERDGIYRDNFDFFLKHGVSAAFDYVICINGGCSLELPLLSNVRYLNRPNVGFDFGAYDDAINSTDIGRYRYFFFVNCTMRGPFLPSYFSDSWTAPFVKMLCGDVKLVGPTINILDRNALYAFHFRNRYSFREPFSHVQSMMFATDQECMTFLQRKGFFNRGNESTRDDVIINHEILLSQEILANGRNISSILPEYRSLDYRIIEDDINPSSHLGDPWYRGRYFHRSLHPFETIFFKTNRDVMEISDLDRLGNSQSKGEAGNDRYSKIDAALSQIPTAWRGHKNFAIWLASRLRAKTIVDLGVDFGYSTFCFALASSGQVFGIDSFEGDTETGFRNTLTRVSSTGEQLGLRNMTIMQGYFEVIARTWDRAIDILHIDGSSEYEAVKNNYLTWSKFVKQTGVVLFHDTCAPNFGIRRLFDEIAMPKVNFSNSYGLGVVSCDKSLVREIARTFECLIEAGSLFLESGNQLSEASP